MFVYESGATQRKQLPFVMGIGDTFEMPGVDVTWSGLFGLHHVGCFCADQCSLRPHLTCSAFRPSSPTMSLE